jgi:hypothetical protein
MEGILMKCCINCDKRWLDEITMKRCHDYCNDYKMAKEIKESRKKPYLVHDDFKNEHIERIRISFKRDKKKNFVGYR